MVDIEKPRIECVQQSEDGRTAQFVVEPLEKGFGITIGTSLRRIMLSQLEGAAATSIEIDGVRHEFSTITGVMEDVTDIVLNLKSVNFKLHTDATEIVLEKSGAGVVTAGDIECNSDVEILNPEQHIATLNDDAKLVIKIAVKKGKGWRVADKNKESGMPIGVIPIDSIFSPIVKVNSRVENTLVGTSTDYEKLILDITTNGAITPEAAIKEAAAILIKKLSIFVKDDDALADDDTVEAQPETQISNEIYDTPIEDLDLSIRPLNCLKRSKINTVGELVRMSPEETMKIHNLGKKSLEEIIEKIRKLGIPYGDIDDSED